MGSIFDGKPNLWLFRINSEGCFGEDDCEDILIVSTKSETDQQPFLNVYPNPTSDIINIKTGKTFEFVRITDLLGNLISSIPFREQIDVSGLSSGIYTLTLVDALGKRQVELFVKN